MKYRCSRECADLGAHISSSGKHHLRVAAGAAGSLLGSGRPEYRQLGINDLCDLSGQTLTSGAPLDDGFLDRANRFLRLWLATGYKMWELDLLLNAPSVGNGTLNQTALVNLQAFWQLQKSSSLAVNQQLAFFQNIDTNTHRDPDGSTTTSLYAQVFLNPTTTWIAADPDLVSISTGGPIGDPILSDHAKAVQPVLGV
jgi:hypothetical protein